MIPDIATREIVTSITFMLGCLLTFAAGMEVDRRNMWSSQSRNIYALALFLLGLVFVHTGLARMYGEDHVRGLLDLDGGFTLLLRMGSLFSLVLSCIRLSDDRRESSGK